MNEKPTLKFDEVEVEVLSAYRIHAVRFAGVSIPRAAAIRYVDRYGWPDAKYHSPQPYNNGGRYAVVREAMLRIPADMVLHLLSADMAWAVDQQEQAKARSEATAQAFTAAYMEALQVFNARIAAIQATTRVEDYHVATDDDYDIRTLVVTVVDPATGHHTKFETDLPEQP